MLARSSNLLKKWGFRDVYDNYMKILSDPDIDVVDIITPPNTHMEIIEKAIEAGKNVICEKPVAGYFGEDEDTELIGRVSKEKMFNSVMNDMIRLRKIIEVSGKKFFYAEN